MLNEHKPTAENSNCVSRGTALFVCVANVRLLESIERERERERESWSLLYCTQCRWSWASCCLLYCTLCRWSWASCSSWLIILLTSPTSSLMSHCLSWTRSMSSSQHPAHLHLTCSPRWLFAQLLLPSYTPRSLSGQVWAVIWSGARGNIARTAL